MIKLATPGGMAAEDRQGWRARVACLDWRALVSFTLPFVVYLLTLAPTVYNLDSAELTTAAATGGLVRATGYPLYLAIGRIWSLLPIGDVGFRMNLMSAVFGALTVALADRTLRDAGIGGLSRLAALGLLATAPYFWAMSLVAEVYTLHTALMAAIILLLFRWQLRLTPRRLALLIFLTALSLGNHAATVLLVPAMAWVVVTSAPGLLRQPRVLLLGAIALLAGLSIYLLLPWLYLQQPAFNYVGRFTAAGTFEARNLLDPANLWWLISGRSFAGQMLGYSTAELLGESARFARELSRAFFAIGLGPGLVGLFVWLRRRPRQGVALLLMFAANTLFYVNYRVIDKSTMFLPSYLVWALWAAMGYQVLLDWLAAPDYDGARWMRPLARVALVAGVVLAVVVTWAQVDQSDDWSTRRLAEETLAIVEPNAVVLGWWDTVPAVQYLQMVEGARPDVLAINRFLISGNDLTLLIYEQIDRRPIYINSPPVEILGDIQAYAVGPVYRLERQPTTPGDLDVRCAQNERRELTCN